MAYIRPARFIIYCYYALSELDTPLLHFPADLRLKIENILFQPGKIIS
ncbi:hypothetical protein SAMN05660330_00871 [Desulforhopalus singaporensis]|uniref:Uncharacterized protein n=1 Tax=Desulforhopalus singaporensis TaxID=91360 RepID=A0A1H0LV64_9BACT|nr:hypothetical protein SAMN05660330_00871 [Desulforhopalus singaporensis]